MRPHLLRALDELEEVTRGLNVKLQYSHAIFVGTSSFKCKAELVEIIERMRKNGVDAMFDLYSEICGVSVITVVMPTWYQALSKKKNASRQQVPLRVWTTLHRAVCIDHDIQIAYIGPGYEHYRRQNRTRNRKERA